MDTDLTRFLARLWVKLSGTKFKNNAKISKAYGPLPWTTLWCIGVNLAAISR